MCQNLPFQIIPAKCHTFYPLIYLAQNSISIPDTVLVYTYSDHPNNQSIFLHFSLYYALVGRVVRFDYSY